MQEYRHEARLLSIAYWNYAQVGGWFFVVGVIRYCVVLVGGGYPDYESASPLNTEALKFYAFSRD
jgi:hypothetical protein